MTDPERPTIVCLCGSTRFMDAFHDAGWQETLAGKIVLITGSSRGIGLATAKSFAAEGSRIMLSARSVEQLRYDFERDVAAAGGRLG